MYSNVACYADWDDPFRRKELLDKSLDLSRTERLSSSISGKVTPTLS